MPEREHPLAKWFGDRKSVRLLLLTALLALGVIHIEFIINSVRYLLSVASPIITGFIIAYILEIVVKRLEKHLFSHTRQKWLMKSRRVICIFLGTLLVLAIIVLIFAIVIPGLIQAFNVLSKEFPTYFADVKKWALNIFSGVPEVREYLEPLDLDWPTIQNRIVDWAINGIGREALISSTVSVISTVMGSIGNFLISLIFAIFLLGSKSILQSQCNHLIEASVTKKNFNMAQHVLATANRCFSGFIVGQTANGLILGLLTWLGMRIFRMPYALMVAVLSGTTSLIPIIGGYIGAALGAFLVFTVSPGMALWFLVFIIVLQNVQGNLLYPRLVGTSVGLPGLWVLAAVTIGGGLDGIAGMLIAVPLTATVYVLLKEWVHSKRVGTENEVRK